MVTTSVVVEYTFEKNKIYPFKVSKADAYVSKEQH